MATRKKLPAESEADGEGDAPGFVVGPDVGNLAFLGEIIVERGFYEEVDAL